MFEVKYQKYVTKNLTRFAEPEEIVASGTSWDNAAGAPLFYDGKTLLVDGSDNHTLVVGPTGCKKSRVVARSVLASILENGESAVVSDPKGELYKSTFNRAERLGYRVQLINLRNPACSLTGWNPIAHIHTLYHRGETEKANRAALNFATAILNQVQKSEDRYWDTCASGYLAAIIMLFCSTVTKDLFNLRNVLQFCNESSEDYLKTAMKNIDVARGSSIVSGLRSVLDVESERTKSCILSTLQASLNTLTQSEELLDLFSCGDFDYTELGKRKTIVFLVFPDEVSSLNFLVNYFMTQTYEVLVDFAATLPEDRLAYRVNMVYDEFANLPKLSNFSNRISEARSKNLRYFLFIQAYHQLRDKYGDEAQTILSNCGNWIVFSNKEMSFLNMIAEICGKETDYNGLEHYLLSPDQMQFLQKSEDSAEVVVLHHGLRPYVAKLPDFAYTSLATLYQESSLPRTRRDFSLTAKTITPGIWIQNIRDGKYPFPLLRKDLAKPA